MSKQAAAKIDDDLDAELELYLKEKGGNRSKFIATAIREKLDAAKGLSLEDRLKRMLAEQAVAVVYAVRRATELKDIIDLVQAGFLDGDIAEKMKEAQG